MNEMDVQVPMNNTKKDSSPYMTGKSGRKPSFDIEEEEKEKLPEPLLVDNDDRFVIFPIKHNDLWQKYKNHMAVFWKAEEIDLSKDMKDWERLTDNERYFIKNILGFFAGSDGIVMENLAKIGADISKAEFPIQFADQIRRVFTQGRKTGMNFHFFGRFTSRAGTRLQPVQPEALGDARCLRHLVLRFSLAILVGIHSDWRFA